MKTSLLLLAMIAMYSKTNAQISVTAADMPVVNDTLRYSIAIDSNSIVDLSTAGQGNNWDFTGLTAMAQNIDHYQSAMSVNLTYALTISPQAYGYKVADSFPTGGLPLPVSITNMYTFFSKKTGPGRFVAEAFAANMSGLPTPVNYSDEDEWYFFPLQYGKHDSSSFSLSFNLPTFGSMKQQGYRLTDVDGEGTIKTPYYTTAVNCIRVRSEIHEIDSVSFGIASFGIPRNTVEYKWLVNGGHYPAMWITATVAGGTETITGIRYRDSYRNVLDLGITAAASVPEQVEAYPVPSSGKVTVKIPAGWGSYQLEVFDITGKCVYRAYNANVINTEPFASGKYIVRLISANHTGYVMIAR